MSTSSFTLRFSLLETSRSIFAGITTVGGGSAEMGSMPMGGRGEGVPGFSGGVVGAGVASVAGFLVALGLSTGHTAITPMPATTSSTRAEMSQMKGPIDGFTSSRGLPHSAQIKGCASSICVCSPR